MRIGLISRLPHFKIKLEFMEISTIDYRQGFRMMEPFEWDLIIIVRCKSELDDGWMQCIETHSKQWITI